MEEMSMDELRTAADSARKVADICERHGEADGANSARSQQRAFEAEIERRK